MKILDYPLRIAPRGLYDRVARRGWLRPLDPLVLTYSVTAACQSLCQTCRIGRLHRDHPERAARDLGLDEIEAIFASLGPVYFFNLSGGEPFLRPDLAEIVRLACVHLRPRLIHIPTNALAPETIARTSARILASLDELADPSVALTIKPSVDGVGALHDAIRGVPGNFAALEQTLAALLALRRANPRLQVDLGTVISTHNAAHLEELEDWVHAQGIESYRHEIAGQRAEFFNLGEAIAPGTEVYAALARRFGQKIRANAAGKARLTRTSEAVRLVYYELAVQILKERRQIGPCFAGTSSIHLGHDGEVWPCCVLGSHKAFGQLRESGYDLRALMRSERARAIRREIAAGACACPMANMWLTNILLTPRHMARVLWTLLRLP